MTSFYIGMCYRTVYFYDMVCPPVDAQNFKFDNNHYRQGFSWLPVGAAVFSIHDLGGWDTEVLLNEPVQLSTKAVRTIQMPFTVSGHKGVFVGSDCEDFIIHIPSGYYALIVEQGFYGHPQSGAEKDDAGMWCRLWFNLATEEIEAKILVQDEELNPMSPLRMDTLPD